MQVSASPVIFEEIEPRVVMWQSLWMEHHDRAGLEYLELQPRSARGTVVGHDDEAGPFRIGYRVQWDEHWRTTEVEVAVAHLGGVQRLQLKQNGGSWFDEHGEELTAVRGCVDVDIWPTPFTNSLPIRRLQLAEGERQQIHAVWIDALSLSVEKAVQAYTCIDSSSFRFESVESGFAADLTVDRTGLLVEYPGLFTRCS